MSSGNTKTGIDQDPQPLRTKAQWLITGLHPMLLQTLDDSTLQLIIDKQIAGEFSLTHPDTRLWPDYETDEELAALLTLEEVRELNDIWYADDRSLAASRSARQDDDFSILGRGGTRVETNRPNTPPNAPPGRRGNFSANTRPRITQGLLPREMPFWAYRQQAHPREVDQLVASGEHPFLNLGAVAKPDSPRRDPPANTSLFERSITDFGQNRLQRSAHASRDAASNTGGNIRPRWLFWEHRIPHRDLSALPQEAQFLELDEEYYAEDYDSNMGETGSVEQNEFQTFAHLQPESQEECFTCVEKFDIKSLATLSCGHLICRTCLQGWFIRSFKDEALFPPKCCLEAIDPIPFKRLLTRDILRDFKKKTIEMGTKDRTYCSNTRCSEFLPVKTSLPYGNVLCPKCETKTCSKCKNAGHENDCPEDENATLLQSLAEKEGWKQCPGCNRMVERSNGCAHMNCTCGMEFCYMCGQESTKHCNCASLEYETFFLARDNLDHRLWVQPDEIPIPARQNHQRRDAFDGDIALARQHLAHLQRQEPPDQTLIPARPTFLNNNPLNDDLASAVELGGFRRARSTGHLTAYQDAQRAPSVRLSLDNGTRDGETSKISELERALEYYTRLADRSFHELRELKAQYFAERSARSSGIDPDMEMLQSRREDKPETSASRSLRESYDSTARRKSRTSRHMSRDRFNEQKYPEEMTWPERYPILGSSPVNHAGLQANNNHFLPTMEAPNHIDHKNPHITQTSKRFRFNELDRLEELAWSPDYFHIPEPYPKKQIGLQADILQPPPASQAKTETKSGSTAINAPKSFLKRVFPPWEQLTGQVRRTELTNKPPKLEPAASGTLPMPTTRYENVQRIRQSETMMGMMGIMDTDTTAFSGSGSGTLQGTSTPTANGISSQAESTHSIHHSIKSSTRRRREFEIERRERRGAFGGRGRAVPLAIPQSAPEATTLSRSADSEFVATMRPRISGTQRNRDSTDFRLVERLQVESGTVPTSPNQATQKRSSAWKRDP